MFGLWFSFALVTSLFSVQQGLMTLSHITMYITNSNRYLVYYTITILEKEGDSN
jgi:hypothetical protein